MALTKIDDRGLKTPIDLLDNEKIRFGTGNDLEIYHSGTSSYIQDNGTGDLIIRASDQLKIQDTDNGESMAIFNKDGAVELYFNNVKTFETIGDGIRVLGSESGSAYVYMYADQGDDNADKWLLKANADGNFQIRNYSTGSWVTGLTLDGSNNATFAGAVKFSTNTGLEWDGGTGDGWKLDAHDNKELKFQSANSTQIQLKLLTSDATARGYIYANDSNDIGFLDESGNWSLRCDASQNVYGYGTVSDSKGNLRSIPKLDKTSAYTLIASDAGKTILITTGGVTIPNGVFSAGDAVTIINRSGSDQTITQGSGLTLNNSADATSGNRTLAGRGMTTVWFAASDEGYISGAGLS